MIFNEAAQKNIREGKPKTNAEWSAEYAAMPNKAGADITPAELPGGFAVRVWKTKSPEDKNFVFRLACETNPVDSLPPYYFLRRDGECQREIMQVIKFSPAKMQCRQIFPFAAALYSTKAKARLAAKTFCPDLDWDLWEL